MWLGLSSRNENNLRTSAPKSSHLSDSYPAMLIGTGGDFFRFWDTDAVLILDVLSVDHRLDFLPSLLPSFLVIFWAPCHLHRHSNSIA